MRSNKKLVRAADRSLKPRLVQARPSVQKNHHATGGSLAVDMTVDPLSEAIRDELGLEELGAPSNRNSRGP